MEALLLALQIPRPFDSIINIYCLSRPETSASPNSRITVLDGLRKRYMDLAWRLTISMLPESHKLHIPTHEPDYRDWKLDQPPVKIVEYANFLADVVFAHGCMTPWGL